MKLTVDEVEAGFQSMSPSGDRCISYRDYKVSAIENLGATRDQFDLIDFTNNNITTIENFPYLPRLKRLYFSGNPIRKIEEGLESSLPNLQGLVCTNCSISELGDIDPLSKFEKLEFATFVGNPISNKKHYRWYVIHRIPSLKILDFAKIKPTEREEAAKLFSGEEGKDLEAQLSVMSTNDAKPVKQKLTPQQIRNIKVQITKATTFEEVERLNMMLKNGLA